MGRTLPGGSPHRQDGLGAAHELCTRLLEMKDNDTLKIEFVFSDS